MIFVSDEDDGAELAATHQLLQRHLWHGNRVYSENIQPTSRLARRVSELIFKSDTNPTATKLRMVLPHS